RRHDHRQVVRLKRVRTCKESDAPAGDQLAGLDYTRAATPCPAEARRVAAVAEAFRKREIRHHFKTSLFGCAKALTEGFFHILVLALATWFAIEGRITYGDIMTFSILFLNVMTPLSEIHRVIDEGHEASLHVGDLIEMLKTPTDRSFHADAGVRPALVGDGPLIEVDGLRVEYQTADGSPRVVLDGVGLTVGRGERLGVAGRSGCGKTTWLKV